MRICSCPVKILQNLPLNPATSTLTRIYYYPLNLPPPLPLLPPPSILFSLPPFPPPPLPVLFPSFLNSICYPPSLIFLFRSYFFLSFHCLSFSLSLPFYPSSPVLLSPHLLPLPLLSSFLSDFLPFPSLLLILPGESLFFYFPAAPSPPFSLSPFLPFPFPRPP